MFGVLLVAGTLLEFGWFVVKAEVSPPDEALLLGLELVADIDLCTPRCDGDWLVLFTAATLFVLFTPGFGPVIPLNDNELPDREPSLSGYKGE